MGLKHFLEKIEPHFLPGGKHEKWYALYEKLRRRFSIHPAR